MLPIDLKGKNALVTGGSAGIGRVICKVLSQAGARVASVDRDPPKEADASIDDADRLALQADVASFADAEKCVGKVVDRWGSLDILVCNAGINDDGVIWKMGEEQWDRVIEVNLKGAFNYIRPASALFREQKSGKIVTISSINGVRGKFGQANYAATKAGIIGLTKTIARDLGKYGVNCNAVAPGLIETEMMKSIPDKVRDAALDEILLKRLGQPEEIAHVVAFLCSDLARHVTGQVLNVDGGQLVA